MVTLTMLKDYATLIAATITAIGVIVAVLAYLANRRNQREALVQKAYYDYAKMAVDMPELAFPPKQKFDYANQTLNGETLQFEKYEWFVSSMLVTVHFILKLRGGTSFGASWQSTKSPTTGATFKSLARRSSISSTGGSGWEVS